MSKTNLAVLVGLLFALALQFNLGQAQPSDIITPSESCQLPCWWGIIPNQTTLTEAQEMLNQYLPSKTLPENSTTTGGYQIFSPEVTGLSQDLRLDIFVSGNRTQTVAYMQVFKGVGYPLPYFETYHLFTEVGRPSRLYLYADQTENGLRADNLVMYWDEIGLAGVYIRDYYLPSDAPICFDGEQAAFGIYLYDPTTEMLLDEINQYVEPEIRRISDISDLSIEEFAQILIDNEGCLPPDLPVDWDRPHLTATPTATATSTLTFTPSPTLTLTPTVTLTPTPSAASLQTLVASCVSNQGIRRSLEAKINNQQWGAFINEVEAQRNKKIPEPCATQLIEMAQFLRG